MDPKKQTSVSYSFHIYSRHCLCHLSQYVMEENYNFAFVKNIFPYNEWPCHLVTYQVRKASTGTFQNANLQKCVDTPNYHRAPRCEQIFWGAAVQLTKNNKIKRWFSKNSNQIHQIRRLIEVQIKRIIAKINTHSE